MITYYSTFITGLQDLIESSLKKELKNVQINLVLDGLIVYKTNKPEKQIVNIRFLNNTFILLHLIKKETRFSIHSLIKSFLQNQNLITIPQESIKNKKKFSHSCFGRKPNCFNKQKFAAEIRKTA
jgi:hypothetical protein